MKRHTLLIIYVLGFSIITSGFQCGKDFTYAEVKPTFEFSEKLSLTPYKKTYSINDTIVVQFITSDKKLYDKLSNSYIKTDTSQFMVGFYYHKRYPGFGQPEFYCEVTAENPVYFSFTTLYSWYNVLTYRTSCSDTNYNVKVSFIPKKTGIYSIEPFISFAYCPDKINKPAAINKFTFDLADCNKDVWLSIPPASRGGELGYTDVTIDKKEMFVFKVE